MSQQNDILPALAEVIATTTKVKRGEISRQQRFREELEIDSLSMIDLAVAVEDKFGIGLPDEDLERLATVGGLVDYISEKRARA